MQQPRRGRTVATRVVRRGTTRPGRRPDRAAGGRPVIERASRSSSGPTGPWSGPTASPQQDLEPPHHRTEPRTRATADARGGPGPWARALPAPTRCSPGPLDPRSRQPARGSSRGLDESGHGGNPPTADGMEGRRGRRSASSHDRPGKTLVSIARLYYGSNRYGEALEEFNRGRVRRRDGPRPGDLLVIPPSCGARRVRPEE